MRVRVEDADLTGFADEMEGELLPRMMRAVERGGDVLLGKIQDFLSRPSPSSPGNPPGKLTGELHDAMARTPAKKRGREVRVLVGVDHPDKAERSRIAIKAAALEYGGTDRKGRVHPPYPFARPAETASQDEVDRAIDEELDIE